MPTISIPAAHVDELRRAALSLYATKAEAIHLAANEYLVERESLAPLLHHRSEFREVEALLDQLDWRLQPAAAPVDATVLPRLLAELVLAALIARLESLLDQLTAADKEASCDVGEIGRRLDDARTLLGVLANLSPEDNR